MPTLKTSDGELSYEIHGSGEPLVLLHCGFFDSSDWVKQVEIFSKKFKVITYDQRGQGKSAIPTVPHSPVEDLRFLLDSLGIQKANLIGHSIGGQIAINFAAIFPDRVKRLILIGPSLDGYEWSKEYQAWSADLFSEPNADTMARKIMGSGMCVVISGMTEIADSLMEVVRHNTGKILTWKSADVRWSTPPGIQLLGQIQAPTLVLIGDRDISDIYEVGKILEKSIPNVHVENVPGADHMMNFERPDYLNQQVMDFLSR